MLLTLFLWASLLSSRARIVRVPPVVTAERILFIGAHPDDEIMASPLLGTLCVELRKDCSILVLTRGEGGGDAAVRSGEMSRSAAFLNASLRQWTLPDVMSNVRDAWGPSVVNDIRAVILEKQPTVVITMDPHHGSTCHPAHRALGTIVTEAIAGTQARLYFVGTAATFSGSDIFFSAGTDPSGEVIDATNAWHWLISVVQIHASQFTPGQVDALTRVPDEQRRVWLMPAGRREGVRDVFVCP
jgi:LmbE family N-acetylglucosaminyl deacetylase